MIHRSVILTGVLVVLLAATVGAQPVQPVRTQSLAAAAQWAYPVDGGGLSGTPGINVSYRWWFARYGGVEGTFGWWRNTQSQEFHSPAFTGPAGSGPAMDGFAKTELSVYGFGVNILGRAPMGRAALIAGGGPGIFRERGRYDVQFNNEAHSGASTRTHFGVQALVELEVNLTDRVAVFGGLRLEVRDTRDVDSSCGYPAAGVRMKW